ncbi:MAG: TraR/DksA C4-type zinc finger protein [Planctomycetota bacterium]|nr:TraR/DksA C4-type zinc finger protein [Planctomycetota bacterium]
MAKTRKTSASRKRGVAGYGKKRSGTGKTTTKATRKTARKTAAKTKTSKTNKRVKTPVRKSPLDKKHLNEFREVLLQKRRTLVGDMNGMEESAVNQQNGGSLSSMPTHMADVGTDNFEHEFTLGLIESEQSLLGEIDQALRRIENGAYGICLGTGRRIPLARLRAKPWAKYTVEFARMIEQGLASAPEEESETAPKNK